MENFIQTLKEAERKWSDNGRLINSNSELENQISDSIQTDGTYQYPNDVLDSWVAANGSDHHSKIGDSSFKGGFAPKCQIGLQWEVTEDGWKCSGEITWQHEVFFPDISSDATGETTVGFYIMPYVFHQYSERDVGKKSYYEVTRDTSSITAANITGIDAKCWRGQPSDKSSISFTDSNFGESWFSVNIDDVPENPESPVALFRNLTLTGDSYSCSWGFHDTNGDFRDDFGTGVDRLTPNEFQSRINERSRITGINYDLPSGVVANEFSDNIPGSRFRDVSEKWDEALGHTVEKDNPNFNPSIALFN